MAALNNLIVLALSFGAVVVTLAAVSVAQNRPVPVEPPRDPSIDQPNEPVQPPANNPPDTSPAEPVHEDWGYTPVYIGDSSWGMVAPPETVPTVPTPVKRVQPTDQTVIQPLRSFAASKAPADQRSAMMHYEITANAFYDGAVVPMCPAIEHDADFPVMKS